MKALRWMAVPLLAVSAVACGSDSGGGSTEAWCDIAEEVQGLDALDDETLADPTKLEAAFEGLADTFDEAVDAAPSEIKNAVERSSEGLDQMISALKDADYNILDIDQDIFTDLGNDMDEASTEIETFNEKECGLTPTTDAEADAGSDDSTPEASGTARDQIAAQLMEIGLTEDEASCVAENIDPELASQVDADPTAMMDVFTTCNIGLDRLAQIGQGG